MRTPHKGLPHQAADYHGNRGAPMTLAKCEGCGKPLIVPYDGLPFWCIECSMKEDEKFCIPVMEGDET